MTRHRVLHVVGIMDRGGIETVYMNVFRALDRSVMSFDFAVHTNAVGVYDDEIRTLGGTVLALPAPRVRGLYRYWVALGDVLRRGGYCAVHSHVHYFSGLVVACAHCAGVPRRIAHSHTTVDGTNSPLRHIYRQYMRLLLYRHSTHMVSCSQASAEALFGSHCWADQRTCLLPNAISLDPFRIAKRTRKAVRHELGIPFETPLVVHVGRLHSVKNQRFLIEMFGVLLTANPAAELLLVGAGPLEAEYRDLIRAKGLPAKIHMLGSRTDVPDILGASDVFVLPSLYEGIPGALIEAQAAGLPCVVSDTVSREADLKLGLVSFVPLELEAWVQSTAAGFAHPHLEPAVCADAVIAAGYDSQSLARRLQSIYLN